jgi:hypothetical protein
MYPYHTEASVDAARPNPPYHVIAAPPNRKNPATVVITFFSWPRKRKLGCVSNGKSATAEIFGHVPVIDVVSGELIVEQRKMNQFNKNACIDDMRKQN